MQKSWEKKWQLGVRSGDCCCWSLEPNWKPQQVSFVLMMMTLFIIMQHFSTLVSMSQWQFSATLEKIEIDNFIIFLSLIREDLLLWWGKQVLYPWLDFDIKQLMLLGIRNVGQRPHQLAKKKVSQADQRGQFLMWWNNFWLCNKIFWGEIWDRNLVFSMLQLLLAEKRWWCADEFIFLYWKNVNFEGGAKRKQLL